MPRVKVSNKNQIAVPAAARKRLRIQPGDYLLVDIRCDSILLTPEPPNFSHHLRGLHRDVWAESDLEEYLQQERDAWQE